MKDLLIEAARAGIRLEVSGDDLRVTAPPGALTPALRQSLLAHKAELVRRLRAAAEDGDAALRPDPAARHEPFALTSLQYAYWVGRSSGVEMGGTSAHYYLELQGRGLDVDRLGRSLDRLIERHDMLRAVVDRGGLQRILPNAPPYRIAVVDRSHGPEGEAERQLQAIRAELSHQVLRTDRWPLFDIRVTLLPGGRHRLHLSLDLLVFDSTSLGVFFEDWLTLYRRPEASLPPLEITFRDYVLAEERSRDGAAHRRAREYWSDRIDALPAGPALPLRTGDPPRGQTRFARRSFAIDGARWRRLEQACRDRGITASNVVLAAYAEVLARWSATPHFCINMTVSNRRPLHPQIGRVLGDFTVSLLHEVDLRGGRRPFAAFARDVQRRFLDDMDHLAFDGTRVLREWSRRHGAALQAVMPVVFTSALGLGEAIAYGEFGDEACNASQTPQVWLDHHVLERGGELVCLWDVAEAVFEDGVVDAVLASYRRTLERLADDPSAWDASDLVALPRSMLERRAEVNRTAAHVPAGALHAGLVAQAQAHPERAAVIAPERTLSYGELLAESAAVADRLIERGARGLVAVLMRKGWEQAVAVHGVLLAGCAYLPVDADLPVPRQLELLRLGEVSAVLVQPAGGHAEAAAAGHTLIRVDGARGRFSPRHAASLQAAGLAYVIFTSGTTGTPKGVMIGHGAAKNTVVHVNRLLALTPEDRLLGVSALSFDLSVYDIFGAHEAGAALVLPEAARRQDAAHWQDTMHRHRVTVWNSAPQLMRMLMDTPAQAAAPLRAVLLSGDFIPLDLPGRVRARHPAAQILGLGGATEAAIWSIARPVTEVDPAWRSIPYGRPLPNQTVHVLDAALRPRPDRVPGRIHIGGLGLAGGYWRDPALTAQRFVTDPATGERLYDTGDLGVCLPDGEVAILGRDDRQVKLRGHRVELGEVEGVLRRHPAVGQALAVVSDANGQGRLVAYVVPAPGQAGEAVPSLRGFLAEHLPEYMVPAAVVPLAALPLSANGKVDHRALPPVDDAADRPRVAPRDDIERILHAVWSDVLPGGPVFGVTDDFFSLGGDSVLAATLVRELSASLPDFRIEVHELFEHASVEALARLCRQRRSGGVGQAGEPALPDATPVLADVADSLRALDGESWRAVAKAEVAAPRAILLTGGTGWVGAHVLAELLRSTPARVYCLVRGAGQAEARARLAEALAGHGLLPDGLHRLVPVCGDLDSPGLGLAPATWEMLAGEVDAIHHYGASLNVLADYGAHRGTNVLAVAPLLRLASQRRPKRFCTLSPMAVCRRWRDGGLAVRHEERGQPEAEGLLTPYAQSKWAAERILLAAAERGLPLKLYRTSHALPPERPGPVKGGDTYVEVLRAAMVAGVVPDWPQSRLQGVPVDRLAALMVADSLGEGQGVVHFDNHDAWSMADVLRALLGGEPSVVPLPQWLAACREAAARLPGAEAVMLRGLFAQRSTGAAVEHMFAACPLDTSHADLRGLRPRLTRLTTRAYWERLSGALKGPV